MGARMERPRGVRPKIELIVKTRCGLDGASKKQEAGSMMKILPSFLRLLALIAASSAHVLAADGYIPEESLNIGATKHQGGVEFDGVVHRLNGSGSEIFHAEDSFFFTFRGMTGDATITAHFKEGLQFVDPWAKAGLMIRATREADSPNVFLGVTSLNGLVLQNRDRAGAETNLRQFPGEFSTAAGGKGVWLRLTRQGDMVTAFRSENGETWEEIATLSDAQFGDEALFGLAMSSHDENQQYGFANFESVSITEGTPES